MDEDIIWIENTGYPRWSSANRYRNREYYEWLYGCHIDEIFVDEFDDFFEEEEDEGERENDED